ncbi:MAG TPA: FtsX-like permease family protein [Polyangia bacterium]|jgi:putative ABC transport system permease protein|nr:FtsX-like permease family protein [Polyangia bacterium]
MKLLLIAFRNLTRNKLRTFLTVLGAAVAILAFVMLRTVLSAWSTAAEYAAKDRLATRHKVSFVISMPKNYVDQIRMIPGVKSAAYMSWFGGKNPKKPEEFFATLAVDAPSALEVMDELVLTPEDKQRWLQDKKGAIIGDVLSKQLGLKVGDKFTLLGGIYAGDWEFNIDGIYTATRKSVDRSTFLFHWSYMNDSLPELRRDQIGWVTSRIDDPSRGPEIAAAIDKVFDEKDIQTATMSERAMNLSFMGMISSLLKALDIISIIILVIMMMILGNTIAMGVRERTREYGVLRAIGFSPRDVALFVVGEAAAIGLLSGAIGLLLAKPIVELGMGRWLEENMGAWFPYFRIDAQTYVMGLGLAVGLALVASIIPARRAARLPVTEALRRLA